MNEDDLAFTLSSLSASAKSTEARIAELSKLIDQNKFLIESMIASHHRNMVSRLEAQQQAAVNFVTYAEERVTAHHSAAEAALRDFRNSKNDLATQASDRIDTASGAFDRNLHILNDRLVAILGEIRHQQWAQFGELSIRFIIVAVGAALLLGLSLSTLALVHDWWKEPKIVVRDSRQNYLCRGKPNATASNCSAYGQPYFVQ